MKKFSRLMIVFMLLLAMVVPLVPANLFGSVNALSALETSTLTVEGFVREGKIGETIFVPKAVFAGSTSTTTLRVVDPNGVDVTATQLVANGENYNLTPASTGIYEVFYGVSSTGLSVGDLAFETNETRFQIRVAGKKPTMTFADNEKYFIPTTIADDTAITLPYPSIIGTDGNEVALSSYAYTDNENTPVSHGLVITVSKPSGVTGDIQYKTVDVDGVRYVQFTTVENGNGIYTVTYVYTAPTPGNLTVSKSFEIVADTTHVQEEKFNSTLSASVPTSLELGKTTTLPIYTLLDEDGNVVQSYTKIEATFIPANSTGSDHVNCNDQIDGYDFTPTLAATNGALYEIVYKIYDFYGLNAETAIPVITKTHTIRAVKDTTYPTPIPVENYDAVETDVLNAENYEPKDLSYAVPSKLATNQSYAIPAIYARDAYNVTLPANITLKRTIIKPNGAQDTTNFVDNNAKIAISYTFTEEGIYTIKYTAEDAAKNTNTSVSYDVVVEDGFTDAVAPRITVPTSIPSYAKEGTLIKFLKPTAVDYVTASPTETSVSDSRVKIETSYYTNDVNSKTNIEVYEIDEDYLAFRIPQGITGNTLTIYVNATDDFNNQSDKSIVINLPIVTDTENPTLTSVVEYEQFDQDETVTLPELLFNDDNIAYTTLSVDVIDAENNYVNVFGLTPTLVDNSGTKLQAKNAKFIPTVAGQYKAIYTLTDVAGNSLIVAFNLRIIDTILPVVPGPSAWTSEVEVGVSTFLPSSIVTDNGEEITNESLTKVEIVSENHSSNFTLNNYTLEFVSYVADTYQFKYVGKDAASLVSYSKIYTLTVVDNYMPNITVLDSVVFPTTVDLTVTSAPDATPVTYADIVIPGFEADDVHYNEDGELTSLNNIVERYVQVKDPDQKEILKSTSYATTYTFNPSKAGAYTVNYYAKDAAGKERTTTKTVYVGDHVAPVVTIEEAELDKFDAEYLVGDTLSLDMSHITAEDDKDGEITFSTMKTGTSTRLISIKVTNPDGTAVSRITTANNAESTDATPIYELNNAGSYTVSYTVKDNTGNVKTINHTITVEAVEEEEIVSTEVWGIILIILAVAILAGIVIYFIKTRRLKRKPTPIVKK